MEKKIIQKSKTSVKAHLPGTYITGLSNIKAATIGELGEIKINNNQIEYQNDITKISDTFSEPVMIATTSHCLFLTNKSVTAKSERLLSGLVSSYIDDDADSKDIDVDIEI